MEQVLSSLTNEKFLTHGIYIDSSLFSEANLQSITYLYVTINYLTPKSQSKSIGKSIEGPKC